MSNKKILVLGTAARGGIQSVIQAYEETGFYANGNMEFIQTHIDGSVGSRLITALWAFWHVFLNLIYSRVSIIHMHMSMRGSFWRKFILLNMSRVAGVPVIIHLHGSEFSIFYNNSTKIVQRMVQYLFNTASSIVVLSSSWKEFIRTITNNNITVIGNYVPDSFNRTLAIEKRNRNHILFLGEFGKRKGIYDLITAFENVLVNVPDAKLYCGGNGEIEKVLNVIGESEFEGAIHVLGWVSGDEKNTLMHDCSIFVLPSYNEGLPMAIIEALSYSMAVVSTSVGGIPDLVSASNGVLVEPGNVEELSNALVGLLTKDDKSFNALCNESRNCYEQRYSPVSGMSKMRQVYLSLGVEP